MGGLGVGGGLITCLHQGPRVYSYPYVNTKVKHVPPYSTAQKWIGLNKVQFEALVDIKLALFIYFFSYRFI